MNFHDGGTIIMASCEDRRSERKYSKGVFQIGSSLFGILRSLSLNYGEELKQGGLKLRPETLRSAVYAHGQHFLQVLLTQ